MKRKFPRNKANARFLVILRFRYSVHLQILLSVQKEHSRTPIQARSHQPRISKNRRKKKSEKVERRELNICKSFPFSLGCRLLFSLGGLNSIAIAVGIARSTAVRTALAGPLLIISIVIIILIDIHLSCGRLVRWGLFSAGSFFLDLSRRGSRLRSVGRRRSALSHWRKTRALMRRHVLDRG